MRVPPARTNIEMSRESINWVLWLGLILVAATALRLWGLGAKSLWLDEIMTVQKASMSFSGMMGQIRQHDAHPPLFQIVEWLWLRLGQGDAFARAPSVMARAFIFAISYSTGTSILSECRKFMIIRLSVVPNLWTTYQIWYIVTV